MTEGISRVAARPFWSVADYRLPVLRVLASLPGGSGRKQVVVRGFLARYQEQVPPEHLQAGSQNRPLWRRRLFTGYKELVERGLAEWPGWGVWGISQAGRDWLALNPDATSLPDDIQQPLKWPRPVAADNTVADEMELRTFLGHLESTLISLLSSGDGRPTVFSVPGRNFVKVTYQGFGGSHYEVRIAKGFHEIGLHFESNRRVNLARLEPFQARIDSIAAAAGLPLRAEPWGVNGARVWAEMPREPLTMALAERVARQAVRFMEITLSILGDAYSTATRRRSVGRSGSEEPQSTRQGQILEQELATIHRFLAGRIDRPSDERLCDWILFCYTFELFAQGRELFRLVEPSQVNPWYFDRTKRLASVCAMKAEGKA
jgi:hypothetical protein